MPYVVERIADSVEWIETDAQGLPGRGTHRSPQEVLDNVFASIPQHFETFAIMPDYFVEDGDTVVTSGRVRARTRSGRELDAPFAHVFTVSHGKVTRNENHHDTALWRDALQG